MNADFENLKAAHSRLMSKYIDVLNDLQTLPFFVPSKSAIRVPEKPPTEGTVDLPARADNGQTQSLSLALADFTSLFSLRFLVRLFVESHIRGKLLELSVAYSYLAQKHLEDKAYVAWLRETSEDCRKIAETLTSLQSIRGILTVWWPVILSVVTTWLGLETIYDLINKVNIEPSSLILFGLLMAFPLIYLAIFITYSFTSKRDLFTPGFDQTEKPLNPNQPADVGDVVYSLEDQVFPLTGRRKVREIPLDIVGIATSCLFFTLIPVLVWMDDPSTRRDVMLWLVVVFFGGAGVASIFSARKRTWR